MSFVPDDLVELGKVQDAYGLRGWVAIIPASSEPDALLKVKSWWLSELKAAAGQQDTRERGRSLGVRNRLDSASVAAEVQYREVEVRSVKTHGSKVVAHLMGYEDRTQAERLKGARVYVSRSKFPKTSADEFYWVDLVGCSVENADGFHFGEVSAVSDHGAHAILEVGKHLIPFVAAYVLDVKIADRKIIVDWQDDYT